MDVKTLCLGILNRGDATGYEIKKACEDGPFGVPGLPKSPARCPIRAH